MPTLEVPPIRMQRRSLRSVATIVRLPLELARRISPDDPVLRHASGALFPSHRAEPEILSFGIVSALATEQAEKTWRIQT